MAKLFITQDSSVSITRGCGMDGRGSISWRCRRFFSTPQRPDRLWGSSSHLSSGYLGLFPLWWNVQGMKLTTRQRSEWWSYISTPPFVFSAWCMINYAQGQLYCMWINVFWDGLPYSLVEFYRRFRGRLCHYLQLLLDYTASHSRRQLTS
jgi:hypothetical protein